MSRHRVCSTAEVAIGQSMATKAGGTKVLVFHLDDGWYATQASCTHVFAPLAKGTLDASCGHLTCPFHRAIFDVRSGLVQAGPSFPPGVQLLDGIRATAPLKTFPVTVEGEDVYVEV